jgi:hypothetical protein
VGGSKSETLAGGEEPLETSCSGKRIVHNSIILQVFPPALGVWDFMQRKAAIGSGKEQARNSNEILIFGKKP